MNGSINTEIEAWEGEGGATPAPLGSATPMGATPSQLEWARLIKRRVNDEFDRVAASFRSIAARDRHQRAEAEAILGILEDKRAEVMSREQAGYLIHDGQEIGDQVRQMISDDARYQTIKNSRPLR
jgi:hypothetical protein